MTEKTENYSKLVEGLYNPENGLKADFKRGFNIFADYFDIKDISSFNSELDFYKNILAKLLHPGAENYISFSWLQNEMSLFIDREISIERSVDDTDESFRRAETEKRSQYLESARLLLNTIKPLAKKNWKHRIATKHKNDLTSEFVAKSEELQIYEHKLGDKDRLIFFGNEPIDNKLLLELTESINKPWNILRNPDAKPQVLTVLLHDANNQYNSIRSVAMMKQNPSMLLEISNENSRNTVAVHEAIHCVIGADSGQPYNMDFAEGCAIRLQNSLADGKEEKSYSAPESLLGFDFLAKIDLSGEIRSHTQYLERLTEKKKFLGIEWGRQIMSDGQAIPAREFSYIIGFALMDTLLKSQEFKVDVAQAKEDGEHTYRMLLNINRSLSYDNLKENGFFDDGYNVSSNRAVIEFVLKENGIDTDKFFESMRQYMIILQNQAKQKLSK